MTTANLLAFLCGSLVASIIFFVMLCRQSRLDNRIIQHIRRNAYLRGRQDGIDRTWREDA